VMGERLQAGAAPRLDAAEAGGRASALARLAEGMWEDGALLDASFALPVYLRNKVAQTSLERASAASAKALP
jgi:tRNA threonylcarbamoyladenosine biosynthesis protein TsaB